MPGEPAGIPGTALPGAGQFALVEVRIDLSAAHDLRRTCVNPAAVGARR